MVLHGLALGTKGVGRGGRTTHQSVMRIRKGWAWNAKTRGKMGKGEGVKLAQGMDYTLAMQCDLAIDEEGITNIWQCIILCEI